ncbi:MAG: hypothetical protein ACC656_04930 [Candidatus Heimdallarchaeota archaeon]
MNWVTSRKIGILSGIIYALLITFSIPLLIFLDPDFSKSLTSFDPLSRLGSSKVSETYYRALHIFGGILALIYVEMEFIPNRPNYRKLKNWDWIVRSLRLGYLGEIFMGVFDESIFPNHLFATIAYAAGPVSSLVLVSFNLDNQLTQKDKIKRLVVSGYVISIIGIMNGLYFRYSTIRGIWQFLIIITVLSWYIIEARSYHAIGTQLADIEDTPLLEINKISYLMLGFGIYLIIFSFLLYFLPTMWPWSCSVNDRKCDIENAIPLLIAGIILNSFVLYHQRQVKQNRNRFNLTNISI